MPARILCMTSLLFGEKMGLSLSILPESFFCCLKKKKSQNGKYFPGENCYGNSGPFLPLLGFIPIPLHVFGGTVEWGSALHLGFPKREGGREMGSVGVCNRIQLQWSFLSDHISRRIIFEAQLSFPQRPHVPFLPPSWASPALSCTCLIPPLLGGGNINYTSATYGPETCKT